MVDTVKISVGNVEYDIPTVLNFEALEKCWGAISASANAGSVVEATGARLTLLSILLLPTRPDATVKALKAQMPSSFQHMADLGDAVDRLLVASGVFAPPPDQQAVDAVAEAIRTGLGTAGLGTGAGGDDAIVRAARALIAAGAAGGATKVGESEPPERPAG